MAQCGSALTTSREREDYFVWPTSWVLADCSAKGSDHLRQPRGGGRKAAGDIRTLVVGLNPGYCEMQVGQYFVGEAGRVLRTSRRWYPFWSNVGEPGHVLISNIVKLSTPSQKELRRSPGVTDCIGGCFLAEVAGLPHLEKIYVLGMGAWDLFNEFVRPVESGVEVYCLPHPSFSWVRSEVDFVRDLNERLATPRLG